jgi:hypothetical protein
LIASSKLTQIPGQAYQVDIRNLSELEQIVEKVILDFDGRLDIFVANSGSPWLEGSMLDGSIEHYHDMMSTNIDGTFFCARVAGKHWRRQAQDHTTVDGGELLGFKMGSFIATGSIMAHVVGKPQLQAPYNAAKAFIVHLCELFPPHFIIQASKLIVKSGRQISCLRMGRFRKGKQRLTRLYRNRGYESGTRADDGKMERDDYYEVRYMLFSPIIFIFLPNIDHRQANWSTRGDERCVPLLGI